MHVRTEYFLVPLSAEWMLKQGAQDMHMLGPVSESKEVELLALYCYTTEDKVPNCLGYKGLVGVNGQTLARVQSPAS